MASPLNREQVSANLSDQLRRYTWLRRVNGAFADVFLFGSVASSFLATIAAAISKAGANDASGLGHFIESNYLVVIFGALHEVFLTARQSFKWEEHQLFFSKKAILIGLVKRKLETDESYTEVSAGKEWNAVDLYMEDEWQNLHGDGRPAIRQGDADNSRDKK